MRRAAIILATTFTAALRFSSLSLAASDEEVLGHFADKMSGAFRCSAYAGISHDSKEQKRLFQIGLKAARDFVEGIKSVNDPNMGELKRWLEETSTDFVVGTMWQDQSTKVDDEIRRNQGGRWDSDAAKAEAERSYRNGNCSLIQ